MRKNQLILSLALICLFVIPPIFVSAVGTRFDINRTNSRPQSGPYLIINDGDRNTNTRKVSLEMRGPENVRRMRISNTPDVGNAPWQTFSSEKQWFLDFGRGEKIVYVQFEAKNGDLSVTYADAILLDVPSTATISVVLNNGDETTTSRFITVSTTVSVGVEHMQISNTSDFEGVPWQELSSRFSWTLSSGAGKKTVYTRFRDAQGRTFLKKNTINYIPSGQPITEGSLLKTPDSLIYYYGFDGSLHPFSSLAVFHTWYDSVADVILVSNAELGRYPIGAPVSVRPGSWLVQFGGTGTVYGVEPGYRLRPFWSEAEKSLLYGDSFQKRIISLPTAEREFYTVEPLFPAIDTKETGNTDDDRDGLDLAYERQYGSSDTKKDTDGDGLSDYEEIRFWLSDPNVADTNHNGISDRDMLMQGMNPLGVSLTEIPLRTYTYPKGTVIDAYPDKSSFYLFNRVGTYRAMSKRTYRDEPRISAFLVNPSIPMALGKTGSSSSKDRDILVYPTIYKGNTLEKL